MRGTILLLTVLLFGCHTSGGAKWGNAEFAFDTSLADIRNNQVNVATQHDQGIIIDHYKDPMSPEFAHLLEEVLPELVAAAVKAALAQGVMCAIPGLLGGETTDVPNVDTDVIDPVTILPGED